MRFQSSWVLNMGNHLVISVDLLLDKVTEVEIDLVTLDGLDVV